MHVEQNNSPEPLTKEDTLKIIQSDRAYYLRLFAGKLLVSGSLACVSVVSLPDQSGSGSIDLMCGTMPVSILFYLSARSDQINFENLFELEKQYTVADNMDNIDHAVEILQNVAYPEARELKRRGAIVQTNHNILFSHVNDLCLLPSKKRRDQWKTIYPILDRIKPFSSTLFIKARDAVNEFSDIKTPAERIELMRKRANEALMKIDKKGHNKELEEEYRLISGIAKGRAVFSKITYFDLQHALETFGLRIE
jgi:hypothetical protein